MEYTPALVIGASVAGLASAAALQQQGVDFLLLEKEAQVATPWRRHYERLHLHTDKGLSHLPFKRFGRTVPRYPSRDQVVAYLEEYQKAFDLRPRFHTEVKSVKQDGDQWLTETTNGTFRSAYVIVATGAYGQPKPLAFQGLDTFPGRIMHSAAYQKGAEFTGQHVLVVGFGNSACEIAVDLYEHGAAPGMAVRSPVNVIPRDLLGIPILRLSLLLSKLPPRVADALSAPLVYLRFGDLTKLGLRKMAYGPFQQIQRDGKIPLLDIGTIEHIRRGHIHVYAGIDHIAGKTVHFTDGTQADFDALVAAIGYCPAYHELLAVDQSRFDDLRVRVDRQRYFGKDGLYFCGFWPSPTGAMREIGFDAQKIAQDIAKDLHRAPAPRRPGKLGAVLVGACGAVGAAVLAYHLRQRKKPGIRETPA